MLCDIQGFYLYIHVRLDSRQFEQLGVEGGGGFKSPIFVNKSMTMKWNFWRGGGGGRFNLKPSVGGVWKFFGTTHRGEV